MAETKSKAKTTPRGSQPGKSNRKSASKRAETKNSMPEVLADTNPEDREEVILRVIQGLKKA